MTHTAMRHSDHAHSHHQNVTGSSDSTSLPVDMAGIHILSALPIAPTASIFLPTHRAGPDRQQNHIRAKNLLSEARRQLATDVGDDRAAAIFARATRAIEQAAFWQHPQDGLALYCREDAVIHAWTPVALPEQVVVGERCHIKPLMPLLQGDGRFYLLELTQHGAYLFIGARFGMHAVELEDVPVPEDEAPRHPGHEHHTEVRTVHGASHGAARYFGSIGDEKAKERIKHYFHRIDAAVCRLLHGQRTPLVTAGVEYLLPLYWEVSHYPHLIRTGVAGNPDLVPTISLHDRAWQIVAPHFAKAADEARERFAQLRGGVLASEDLASVLNAAHQGRVEDLFVASDTERWGTFDARDGKTREHAPRQTGDEDLLNLALIAAQATRANVQVLPQHLMPSHSDIAAIFRY